MLRPRMNNAMHAGAPTMRFLLLLAFAATAACGIWLQTERFAYVSVLNSLQRGDATSEFEGLLQTRKDALQCQAWVSRVARLQAQTPTMSVVRQIGTALTARNAVLRDLDIQGDAVRVTVVPAAGELNLSELMAELVRVAAFEEVRFVDSVAPSGFRLSWRLAAGDRSKELARSKQDAPT